MTNHEHVVDVIDDYLHDVLPRGQARQVQRHCAQCDECNAALEACKRRLKILRDASLTTPPVEANDAALIQRTTARLQTQMQRDVERRNGPKLQKAAILGTGIAAAILLCVHLTISFVPFSGANLTLMCQREFFAGTTSSLRIILSEMDSNVPLARIPVSVAFVNPRTNESQILAEFTTNAQGTGDPSIELPAWPNGEYELRVTAAAPNGQEISRHTVRLKRSWQLMLTTDKPVYQPGQTLQVRCLALRRPDRKPVGGEVAEFSVTDPKGNVILRQQNVTSRFGISSVQCPLAREILQGDYEIACEIGDTKSTTTVEVKNYVLPKFRAQLTADKPYYQPGDLVRCQLQCDYFFGKPVANGQADVEIRIADEVIETRQITTDEDGRAECLLRLDPEQTGDEAPLTIHARVKDPAGQRVNSSLERICSNKPIRLEVIPESPPVAGLKSRIFVVTSRPDGSPVQTRVSVSGFDEEFLTTAAGVAVIDCVPSETELAWKLQATDASGQTVAESVELSVVDSPSAFLLRTDKVIYDAGTTLHIDVHGFGDAPVFFDVIQAGQTLLTNSIVLSDGRGSFPLDLPAEYAGTLEIVAYRYDSKVRRPIYRRRIVQVQQSDALQLTAVCDRPEYRPGETAKLTLQLRDRHGNPQAGAFSLAAVDEAVFGVAKNRPGTEAAVFQEDAELLKPMRDGSDGRAFLGDLSTGTADDELLQAALFSRANPSDESQREQLLDALLPYLDDRSEILEILDRTDWRGLVGDRDGFSTDWFPQEVLDLLDEGTPHHPLYASTGPIRKSEFERQREQRLETVRKIWIAVFVVVGLILLSIILGSLERVVEFIVALGLFLYLIALLMPAVQQAREASRRTMARNDLKQIGLAAYNFVETGGLAKLPGTNSADVPNVRVRSWFPETLLWRPEIITDDNGKAIIDVPLADSITNWRLSASAVTARGELGGLQTGIRVFQPYFVDLDLPVTLTRNDEITVPVVVYNYLDEPIEVDVRVKHADWFEVIGEANQTLQIAQGEVKSLPLSIRALRPGRHQLEVLATGGGVADAIRRNVRVNSDGHAVDQLQNGTVSDHTDLEVNIPKEAIPGSTTATLRMHPSRFSQVVEGLEAIFSYPTGCFEQTSSSTYPNVLALDYMQRNGLTNPAIEAKARRYIQLGYQRLLTFEVPGGGFDWFGHAPANRTLTAYGLMEFEDMARVQHVDLDLIDRTRKWLLDQQNTDGSWSAESHGMHDDPTSHRHRQLTTTAYIAAAVFRNKYAPNQSVSDAAARARRYLRKHSPQTVRDPYTQALVIQALQALNEKQDRIDRWLDALVVQSRTGDGDKTRYWISPESLFFSRGTAGSVESTSLAILTLTDANRERAIVRGALNWLSQKKDRFGIWHSTQSTILALKALMSGQATPDFGETPRRIRIRVNGVPARTLQISNNNSDVVQQVDLTDLLPAGKSHTVQLDSLDDIAVDYQLSVRHFEADAESSQDVGRISLAFKFDRDKVAVSESVRATATLKNPSTRDVPMVVAELPIPPGFQLPPTAVDSLRAHPDVAKCEQSETGCTVYLRGLAPQQTLELSYQLAAAHAAKVTAPAATAWEYYNNQNKATSQPVALEIESP